MTKLHFRPYVPIRVVSVLVDSLDLSNIKALYKEYGRSLYDPQMMLKVIIYAYMNNVYSCRKIEKLLLRDIHYIWLGGYEKPDFITINRFRNWVKHEINHVFTELVLLLAGKGYVSLDVEYIDGTKIESKANKYTFVWRKSMEKNRTKLLNKIRILLEQIDDTIAQDKATENESVEFTPAAISDLARELKEALAEQPAVKTKEEKRARLAREKEIKELEKHGDKLAKYERHLQTLGDRNSYSKSGHSATFMRMKEDAMNNG